MYKLKRVGVRIEARRQEICMYVQFVYFGALMNQVRGGKRRAEKYTSKDRKTACGAPACAFYAALPGSKIDYSNLPTSTQW